MSWDDNKFTEMFSNTPNSQVVTAFLEGKDDPEQVLLADLTEAGRAARALSPFVEAGTRVTFQDNLGAYLSYPHPPAKGVNGTVVKVRTSTGDTTCHEDRIFVKWDNGNFMPTHREHLRIIAEKIDHRFRSGCTRTYDRFIVAGLGILGDEFLRVVGSDTDLVHKATKDLWSMSKGDDGSYVIERLFDDNGSPLKA